MSALQGRDSLLATVRGISLGTAVELELAPAAGIQRLRLQVIPMSDCRHCPALEHLEYVCNSCFAAAMVRLAQGLLQASNGGSKNVVGRL